MKISLIEDSSLIRTRLEDMLDETPNMVLVVQIGKSSGVVQAILALSLR